MKDWKPDSRAYVARWLEEAAVSGEIARRAERDGVSYGDAAVELAAELERPYRAIEEKYGKRQAPAPDEGEIDRRARSYADKHNVGYAVALEAVLPGSTGPVELAEDSSEKPKVDDADAALDRKAEARARREGISYEAALEAVLEEM
jgi:hypothetical protein